ncbi:hypothetical protein DYB30_013861, partial [Aphanomyces astaci]
DQARANVAIASEIGDVAATSVWLARLEGLMAGSSSSLSEQGGDALGSLNTRPLLPQHIFVCVHGIYGKPSDSDHIAAALTRTFGESAKVLQSAANTHKTHLGVRLMGTNLAIEVLDMLHSHQTHPGKDVPTNERRGDGTRLSFIGHSLGGIVARYAIVYLQAALIAYGIQPTSFTTLYSVFMAALKAFDHRTAVAMLQGDYIVPRASAAIQPYMPTLPRPPHPSNHPGWQWSVAYSGFADELDTTTGSTSPTSSSSFPPPLDATSRWTADDRYGSDDVFAHRKSCSCVLILLFCTVES